MKTQVDTIIQNLEKKEKIISYLKNIYRVEIGEEPTIPQAYLDQNIEEDNDIEISINSNRQGDINMKTTYSTFEEKFYSLKFPLPTDKKIKEKVLRIRREMEKHKDGNHPYKHLIDLDISEYGDKGFNLEIFKTIINILKLFKCLKSIDLSRNNIDDTYLEPLLDLLAFPKLRKINLSYNNLTKVAMKKINSSLRNNSNMSYMDFRYNQFCTDELTCFNICNTLKNNDVIEFFGLSDSTRDSSALKLLTQKNKNIKTLLVDDSKYKPRNIDILKRSLVQKTCQLEILSLKFNTINIISAHYLEKALKFNRSLLYLNLSCCGISDLSGSKIISSMDVNRNLTELDISNNKISDLFCEKFSGILKVNKTLVKVNLTKNSYIYDNHFQKVVESLVENQSILCLGNLEETKISVKLRESVEFILNLNKECNIKSREDTNIDKKNLYSEDTQKQKYDFLKASIDFEIFKKDYDLEKLVDEKGNKIINTNFEEKEKSIIVDNYNIEGQNFDENDFGEEYNELINKYNVEFGIDEYQDFNFSDN